MPIVSMQKMSLVAHNCEKSRLLRIFVKQGCVELLQKEEHVNTPIDRERKSRAESKRFRMMFALSFLKEMSKELLMIDKKTAPKIDLKKENRLISLEEYEEVCNNTEELYAKIDEMENINNKIVDLRNEKTRLKAQKEQLLPYETLSIPFSKAVSTQTVSVFCGIIGTDKKEILISELPTETEIELSEKDKHSAIVVVCHKSAEEKVKEVLSKCDFVKTSYDFDMTANEKLNEINKRITTIDEICHTLILSTVNYVKLVPTLKIAYDYSCLEIAKIDIAQSSKKTNKAIVFEGWVPSDKVETLKKAINEKCSRVEYSFREPFENEQPPTLVKNNKVVGAFSGITSMFGAPNYREQDPNLFVAFFYFLIFGIMIGDAGYGLIMAIACFLFVKWKKPVKNSGQMIIMFAFCGISTFIWGVLFGGWFAIEISENSFLDKLTWFNPLEEPLKMFMLSLGVGILQIGTGFALNGVAQIKSGRVVKGILSDFGWVTVFIGLFMLFPNIMVYLNAIDSSAKWFGIVGTIGMYVAIVGFVMIIVGGAWGKKNPVKMLGGAFGSVYGAINIVSDLLSYSRLFGLGLTTGVIGLVMNKLGMIIVDMVGPVGWVFAVVIFVGGHIFNLGINLLGAYVHDSRLQYIEFFGRFYDGSGHAFKPLGSDMKYTYLDN